jgi:hypothetical protein
MTPSVNYEDCCCIALDRYLTGIIQVFFTLNGHIFLDQFVQF